MHISIILSDLTSSVVSKELVETFLRKVFRSMKFHHSGTTPYLRVDEVLEKEHMNVSSIYLKKLIKFIV